MLEREAANGARPAQIADAVASTLREIDAVLRPIIGERGVAALYRRSLYLTALAHPWLTGMHEAAQATLDAAPLESVLAQQESVRAAAGGGALLQTLHALLGSLIGSSLTERLLRSVWAKASSGPLAKDTP